MTFLTCCLARVVDEEKQHQKQQKAKSQRLNRSQFEPANHPFCQIPVATPIGFVPGFGAPQGPTFVTHNPAVLQQSSFGFEQASSNTVPGAISPQPPSSLPPQPRELNTYQFYRPPLPDPNGFTGTFFDRNHDK